AARISTELAQRKLSLSPSGVRSVWIRYGLATAAHRVHASGAARKRGSGVELRGTDVRTNRAAQSDRPATAEIPVDAADQLARPKRRPPRAAGGISALQRVPDRASTTASALLRIALDLFAAKNYSTVTIKDIAEATGMNASLIYYYFGSK